LPKDYWREEGFIYHLQGKDYLLYYPLEYVEYKEKRPWVTSQVTRFTSLEADGGKLVFPLAITIKIEPPGGVGIDWTISDASVKVNHHIEEDLFTLSPSMAKSIVDYDDVLRKCQNPARSGMMIRNPLHGADDSSLSIARRWPC
jgi:hypothetical protein